MSAPRSFAKRRARLAPAALLALACACSVNPATGRREFTLVSTDQELALGKEGYPAAIAQYGQYDDARVAAYVDSIGQRLAHVSERPELQWHFTVLDDPVVNAFAMPGGYIFITRGILAHLNSEAQLAGVLGHEIGHVTARHSAKQITQQELLGVGLGVAGAVSETFARYSGTAQQALGLLMLKYSRDDETQADALGIRYATAAGWDPREIPNTYAMLKRISERGGSSLPFYLSTHPDPGDREQRTTAEALQAVQGKSGLVVNHRGYVERVRGIVYGDDPRQGYVEDGRFYAPSLGVEMTLPAGWTTQNSRSMFAAVEPKQAAMLQLAVAANAGALGPADFVAKLRSDGHISGADGGELAIGGWPAWSGRVAVPGSNGAAAQILDATWVRQSPERMFQCLGQSASAGDANERAIVASARSLRAIQEAARLTPTPQRLRLVAAPASGTLAALFPRLGASALALEDTAILNGVDANTSFGTGQWIKLVEPGRRR